MSAASNPTRRTLVKGAAWSVPVVGVGSHAAHAAVSPCSIEIDVECRNGALVFSWRAVGGQVPSSLTFALSIGRTGGGNDGTTTGIGNTTIVGSRVTTPSNQSEILQVRRNSNSGTRTFTLTGDNCAGSICGRFDGSTCVDSC